MEKISDIAKSFGTQKKMALAVGANLPIVERWCQRNTIPAKWLRRVITASEDNNVDLTIDRLVDILSIDQDERPPPRPIE